MKRSVWTAAAAIILAAAVAIPVIAQPPQGGRGPGRGPGMRGPMPMLRGLNLSDAQREEIKTLTEQRRTGEDPRRNLMDLERQLQTAILADTPDQQKIEQLRNSISAASAQELAARIELQTRIAQILTPEQRVQARESVAKGPGPGAGRRGGFSRPTHAFRPSS
jgi:protein CpxP